MDKLEAINEFAYRIALYIIFFALGLQVAGYIIEKHPQEAMFIPVPCEECEEKRRESQEHGRN